MHLLKMSPKDEITPEEKLLRLIRRSDKKVPKENRAEQPVAHKENKPAAAESTTRHKAPKFQEIKILFSGIKSVNFVLINRLIILISSLVLLLFCFNLYFISPKLSKTISAADSKPKTISLTDKEIKPYTYYQQEISKRNLFKTGPLEGESKKVVPAGSTFRELVKDLNLLGIVSGDNPQVIIEDKKLQKTYFLYAGDYLGEVKVEAIHSDSVILGYKGEKISLFL